MSYQKKKIFFREIDFRTIIHEKHKLKIHTCSLALLNNNLSLFLLLNDDSVVSNKDVGD